MSTLLGLGCALVLTIAGCGPAAEDGGITPANVGDTTATSAAPSTAAPSTAAPSTAAPVPSAAAPAAAPPAIAPPAAPAPPKRTTPPKSAAPRDCDPSYPDLCIPTDSADLDCPDVGRKNFRVRQPDPHGFDRDKDGIGCES